MVDHSNDDQENSQEANPDLGDDGVAQDPEAEEELGDPDSDQTESERHTDPNATEEPSSLNKNPYATASSSRNSQRSVNREYETEVESETESVIKESFYGVVTHWIVESQRPHKPLSIGSIVWDTAKRVPLGHVESISGPARQPTRYTVRLDPQNEIEVVTSTLMEDSGEDTDEGVMQRDRGKRKLTGEEESEKPRYKKQNTNLFTGESSNPPAAPMAEAEGSGLAAVPPQQRSLILRLVEHLNVPDDDQVVPTMIPARPPRLSAHQQEYNWIHQMQLARQREMPRQNQNRDDDHVVPQPSTANETSVNQQQNNFTNAPPRNPNPDQQGERGQGDQQGEERGPEDEDQ